MPKRMLVALDQTPPPAEVLDLVNDAARGGGAVVRLLHVVPIPSDPVGAERRGAAADAAEERGRLEAEHRDRLRTVEWHFGGVETESVIRFGDIADTILREAETFHADVIVMSARGRAGVSRLICGSVAEQVVGRAPMTVVLVRRSMPAW